MEVDPEQEAFWLARFRAAEVERVRRRKYRYLARNGDRSENRKCSLAGAEVKTQANRKLSRSDLSRIANDILNPRRAAGL